MRQSTQQEQNTDPPPVISEYRIPTRKKPLSHLNFFSRGIIRTKSEKVSLSSWQRKMYYF